MAAATSRPTRSAISKASSPASARARRASQRAGQGREPVGPDAIHLKAQDKTVAAGGKLADQEKFKRDEHPFDAYPRLVKQAREERAPKPADNFRWRYYGLFYVAPAQNATCAGCASRTAFSALAIRRARRRRREILRGRYAHVTTRANLQIREIEPKNAVNVVEAIQDLGLCSRGSGADNIRNVTGTPTAGIDPQELLDTRPLCARVALSHPQRSLALRPAAQVQRRLDGAGPIACWKRPTTSASRRSR